MVNVCEWHAWEVQLVIMPLLLGKPNIAADINPTAEINVEWPPGVPNFIPGYTFNAATVHVRRAFPGTIIRSLATTRRPRSALPIRPIFSEWEMRETGPKLLAFIRPWWWRAPNQNVIVESGVQGVRPVYTSPGKASQFPGGAQMVHRSRITRSLAVAGYTTTPPTMLPEAGTSPANPLGINS